jgi:alkanesulfonate monooxygenase SsuD/methylene tetrahydromethanopterin reductase-like flavin-dependent oxidoreductase (luciferase family)
MDWSWTDSPGVALTRPEAPAHVARWARAAERAGLGSLWLIEDYFQPGAFALAGAAAAVTDRAIIGLGVVNPYTRHPALLAMETAALAGVAPGRVVLGLGSSNRRWIEAQMGIPFKTPLADLREGVSIVRRLLAGERVTVHGGRPARGAQHPPCYSAQGNCKFGDSRQAGPTSRHVRSWVVVSWRRAVRVGPGESRSDLGEAPGVL